MICARFIGGIAIALLAAGDASAAFTFDPHQAHAIDGGADAIAIGDINGDGRDDVVLTARPQASSVNDIVVFKQRADGTFATPDRRRYGAGYWSQTSLAMADLDRDGIQDVIIGHFGGITIFSWAASASD